MVALAEACATCPIGRWGQYGGGCGAQPAKGSRATRSMAARSSKRMAAGPGTWLTRLIARITGAKPNSQCGCVSKAVTMDKWGWVRSIRESDQILNWLVTAARQRGHRIGRRRVVGLLGAMFIELSK